MNIAFYISGHGFGHARRAGQVMGALLAHDTSLKIHVRTSAPAWLFAGLDISHTHVPIDAGAVEIDPLHIDGKKTLEAAGDLLAGDAPLIAAECSFLQEWKIALVLADIPFLAGLIARRANLPSIAIGNFTWDWIYEPYVHEFPEFAPVLEQIKEAYRQIDLYLRLPLSHETSLFRKMRDVPLVARCATRSADEVLRHLGIDPSDPRPRVLIGMRGGLSAQGLANAASDSQIAYLYPDPIPPALPKNVVPVRLDTSMTFIDVLSVCRAALCKFGYGIVADCASAGVPLLRPRRFNFREEPLFEDQASAWIAHTEIPAGDFSSGDWSLHVHRAMELPTVSAGPMDGAESCAKAILDALK